MIAKTARSAKHSRPADWSLVPRGPVSATAQATLGVAALAAVGDAADIPALWAAGAATAGSLSTVLVGARHHLTPTALGYRVSCWAGAGGWLTWTLGHTPWDTNAWAALAVGAITAGVLAPLGRMAHRKPGPDDEGSGALVLRSGGRIGAEWQARIRRVCRAQVTVTAVRPWQTGAGYDVHADLPLGGVTIAHIARAADRLATDARLPNGCGVEVARGDHRGAIILRVATVNRLDEMINYPDDYSVRSIMDEIGLGEHRDSSSAAAPLRENSVLVVGQKGSGKTNLLDVITAGVGRCKDALVWHIDLNGGGMSQAWLTPWLEGDTDRPAVDWAAADPEEAVLMAETALAIAKHRKTAYRKLKINSDSKLLPLSTELPEIVLVLDEGAEGLSPTNRDPVLTRLRRKLEEIQRIGRNEGVNVVISSLRATADMISPNIKKQSAIRIGMLVQDDEELSFLFGWNRGLDAADLTTKGAGFLQSEQTPPRAFKAYFLSPRAITRAATSIARTRPELDAASRLVAGDHYDQRHCRMREAFNDLSDLNAPSGCVEVAEPAGELLQFPSATPPAHRHAPAPMGHRGRLHSVELAHDAQGQARGARVDRRAAATWQIPSRTERVPSTASPPATWTAGPRGTSGDAPVRPVGSARQASLGPQDASGHGREQHPLPPFVTAVLSAFGNDTRAHTVVLAEAVRTSKRELSELLRSIGVRPLPEAFSRNGTALRGYERAHVEAAADRIRTGELPVPPQIAAWTAA